MRPLAILLVLALAAAAGPAQPIPAFQAGVVADAGQPVYALVRDSLDLSFPGEQLAYLAADGSVTVCVPGADAWQEFPAVPPGDTVLGMWDRPTLDAGDVLGSHPNAEIVVQACRQLIVAQNTGPSWDSEVLFDSAGMTGNAWGARAGDYDPSRPGEEILLIYEGVLDTSFGTIYAESSGGWADTVVYSAEVGMDSAVGEFNSEHDGLEICVPTEMWPAYEIHPPEAVVSSVALWASSSCRELWPSSVMWLDFDEAAWVVEIADVDPAHPDNEVVYGTRYSNSITVSRYFPGVGHGLEVAFTGSAAGDFLNMWDIAVGDVLPDTPEREIVGVDDAGNVYLVSRNDAMEWVGETIWTDRAGPLYTVATCDVDDSVEGDEILVAGASGELTLLRRVTTSAEVPDSGSGTGRPALVCHPNPVSEGAEFALTAPSSSGLTVVIHDLRGRVVSRIRGCRPASVGERRILHWDGRDGSGRRVPSGVYFARFDTGAASGAVKFVVLR